MEITNFDLKKITKNKKIAYATKAYLTDNYIVDVTHHDNLIARYFQNTKTLVITGHGWNSKTTAARLTYIIQETLDDDNDNDNSLLYVTSRNNKKEQGLFLRDKNDPSVNIDIQHRQYIMF